MSFSAQYIDMNQGRIQDFSEGGAPYEKCGWGGGGGQFASGPIYEKWGGGGGSPLQVRYTKSGGAIRFRADKKSGGGGGPLQVRYTKSVILYR